VTGTKITPAATLDAEGFFFRPSTDDACVILAKRQCLWLELNTRATIRPALMNLASMRLSRKHRFQADSVHLYAERTAVRHAARAVCDTELFARLQNLSCCEANFVAAVRITK
jgi:hypothetical protein